MVKSLKILEYNVELDVETENNNFLQIFNTPFQVPNTLSQLKSALMYTNIAIKNNNEKI